jgi:hypothetical protein
MQMAVVDHPLWREWLEAEKTLAEAREHLRTVEHLDPGDEEFKEAWRTYMLAKREFDSVCNKL